jgi:hypothetical protein
MRWWQGTLAALLPLLGLALRTFVQVISSATVHPDGYVNKGTGLEFRLGSRLLLVSFLLTYNDPDSSERGSPIGPFGPESSDHGPN